MPITSGICLATAGQLPGCYLLQQVSTSGEPGTFISDVQVIHTVKKPLIQLLGRGFIHFDLIFMKIIVYLLDSTPQKTSITVKLIIIKIAFSLNSIDFIHLHWFLLSASLALLD